MANSSLTFREAIEQIDEPLSTSVLLRILAEHRDWLVCTKLTRNENHTTALLFWDADAHKIAQQTLGEMVVPELCLHLPGHRIFSNTEGVVDAISINPGSADAFVVPKELLNELESAARRISLNRRRGDRHR